MSDQLQDERRQRDANVTTTVHRAIQRMDEDNKTFLRKVGLGLSAFCIVTPVLSEIALKILQPEGEGLWAGLWAFCLIGFVGGLCFMSEKVGSMMLAFVSRMVEIVIPAALKAKYPARGSE